MNQPHDKSGYNKKYNHSHAAFPVRLGPLKDIIQGHAFDNEKSIHECIVNSLEVQFLPQLIEESKKYKFNDVVELLKLGNNLREALKQSRIPEIYFYLSVPEDRLVDVCLRLKPRQAYLLRQKVGYYSQLINKNCCLV